MLSTITPIADVAMRLGPGGGHWPLLIVGPILWVALIVTLVLLFRRSMHRRPFAHAAAAGESALATRFANGDIDETEFRSRLAVLRSERSVR